MDGVLTEGELLLVGEDLEAKRFNFHDGLGIILLRSAGVKVALMSDRQSAPLNRRATEMGVDEIAPVLAGDKETSLEALLEKFGLAPDQVGYIGDDLRDVPPMKRVGLPLAVADARPEVKACSVYVTRTPGGRGAVREAVEWLLELRGQKESLLRPYLLTRQERQSGSSDGLVAPVGVNKWFGKLYRLLRRD